MCAGIISPLENAMLETKRLKLVAFEKDDSGLVARWDESPDVRKYFFANAYALSEPEREKEMFDQFWEPHIKPEPEDIVYMYYRAYGTKGIIRTGMFFGTPNKMGMLTGWS